METARWILVGAVLVLLLAGPFVRRYSVRLGMTFQILSTALAMLLGAAACGWTAAVLLAEPDPLRIAGALISCLLGALVRTLGCAEVLRSRERGLAKPEDPISVGS